MSRGRSRDRVYILPFQVFSLHSERKLENVSQKSLKTRLLWNLRKSFHVDTASVKTEELVRGETNTVSALWKVYKGSTTFTIQEPALGFHDICRLHSVELFYLDHQPVLLIWRYSNKHQSQIQTHGITKTSSRTPKPLQDKPELVKKVSGKFDHAPQTLNLLTNGAEQAALHNKGVWWWLNLTNAHLHMDRWLSSRFDQSGLNQTGKVRDITKNL